MKLHVYAVKDAGIEAFLPPFYARADGEAKRMFIQACRTGNLKDNVIYFALYHIGYYNDVSALLETVSQPARLMTGLEAINTTDDNPLLGAPNGN